MEIKSKLESVFYFALFIASIVVIIISVQYDGLIKIIGFVMGDAGLLLAVFGPIFMEEKRKKDAAVSSETNGLGD